MDWVLGLSQKVKTFLDTEGIMATHEDAFDFVEHQLQTVGNSFENQFQTVSTNIEFQLQTIRANVQHYYSAFKLEAKSQLVYMMNENIEPTALRSSARLLDLTREEDPNLADVEYENIKPIAPESPMLCAKNISAKGLKKSSTFVDDDAEGEDSKLGNVENENIELPTAPESLKLCTKINNEVFDEISSAFVEEADSDDTFVSSKTVFDTDLSIPEVCSEEFRAPKYIPYADNSGYKGGHDMYSQDFTVEPFVFFFPKPVEPIVYEQRLDQIYAPVDCDKLSSLCFKTYKSDSDMKIKRDACAVEKELKDPQDYEHLPTSDSECRSSELNLDGILETSDYDFCDSDWEII